MRLAGRLSSAAQHVPRGTGREGVRSELASGATTGPGGRSPLPRKSYCQRTPDPLSTNPGLPQAASERCSLGTQVRNWSIAFALTLFGLAALIILIPAAPMTGDGQY